MKFKFWLIIVPVLFFATPILLLGGCLNFIGEHLLRLCHKIEERFIPRDPAWVHVGDGIYRYDYNKLKGS